jgi:hypothetical protein
LNLNLTRAEAYSRTRLARLAGDVPQVISLLKTGEVSLSALRILAPILTTENAVEVLAGIRGKTTREVEDFRNVFRPVDKPVARGVVRTIFSVDRTAIGAVPVTAPVSAPVTEPVTEPVTAPVTAAVAEADRSVQKSVRMSFTLNEQLWNKYQRACNLSNHSTAGGDVAEVMEILLDQYLKRHDIAANTRIAKTAKDEKIAKTEIPNSSRVRRAKPTSESRNSKKVVLQEQDNHTRYIPVNIRRQVRQRDGERCSYVDSATGQRCECTRGLQYDHIKPFALGGASDVSENLRLLCAAHNRLAAENVFGLEFVSAKIQNASAG